MATFSLQLSKAIENIKEDTEKKVRGTLLGVVRRIILRTPVGNPDLWIYNAGSKESPRYVDYIAARGFPKGYVGGSLRGAWQASITSPTLTPRNNVDKNGQSTIDDAGRIISTITMGQNFYLTNALPYAYRVEYGWSTQAPNGMLRLSVMETQQVLDKL